MSNIWKISRICQVTFTISWPQNTASFYRQYRNKSVMGYCGKCGLASCHNTVRNNINLFVRSFLRKKKTHFLLWRQRMHTHPVLSSGYLLFHLLIKERERERGFWGNGEKKNISIYKIYSFRWSLVSGLKVSVQCKSQILLGNTRFIFKLPT